MTSLTVPAVTIIICSAIILTITYSYLYIIDKKSYLRIWAVSWLVYLLAQVITLVTVSGAFRSFVSLISYILFLASMLLLIKGSCMFLNKNMPFHVNLIIYITIIWLVVTTMFEKSLVISNYPAGVVLGIGTIWVGIIFLYYGEGQIHLRRILGISFVLWGIHKLDYPLLRSITWFAPYGYMISALFSMVITIALIFIYFEKVRMELVEAQKILISKEKRLVNIIENQRDIIFELDENGVLTFISPSCKSMFGCSDEELFGRCFLEFFGVEIWAQIKNDKGNGMNFERQWTLKDNSYKYLNVYCKPRFNYQNRFNGIFGSIQDITENKLLVEAKEYDKVKTEFFANISHELKTPLNVILASTQLLDLYNSKENYNNIHEKIEKTSSTIKQNIFRLSRLINNIIDITRVDTGYLELQLTNHNIVSLVEEITMSVVDYFENKGISINFDTEIEEKIIALDREKIERVMLNLLSNSVKFTNSGGKIMVKVCDGDDFVAISVQDTGIGIPIEKQDIIFERFRQVDKSFSRNNEGSGIGLSLVKSLVELHGGSVTVKSIYGKGSEFIITLPVIQMEGDKEDSIIESFCEKKKEIEFSDIST